MVPPVQKDIESAIPQNVEVVGAPNGEALVKRTYEDKFMEEVRNLAVSVSVSVYYLATISYTSRNNKYIHKISRSSKEGHKKPQGLYEMDLLNPRV